MLPALVVLALISPPPPLGPPFIVRYGLAVNGRLKAGATLKVSVTETDIPTSGMNGNAGGPTPTPRAFGKTVLCYQHGTSKRLCGPSQSGQWTVRLESGREQFLILRIGGKTVARTVYRHVQILGRPARGAAPLDATPPVPPAVREPATVSATGGLNGLKKLHVGSVAYFWWSHVIPSTLCYKHGTSRVRCQRSALGGFYITVLPGHDQYFTLKEENRVRSRLVYHHVT